MTTGVAGRAERSGIVPSVAVIALLLLMGCATPPAQPPAPASDSDWGLVQMECRGDETGMSSACRVLSERPAGRGFGASALETARRNPVPMERGAVVRYTVRYRLDAAGPPKP